MDVYSKASSAGFTVQTCSETGAELVVGSQDQYDISGLMAKIERAGLEFVAFREGHKIVRVRLAEESA